MKYIVDIDTEKNKEQERSYALSGINKALYIAKAIAANGVHVEFISPAPTKKSNGYVSKKKYDIDKNISVRLFSTFGCENKLIRKIRYVLLQTNFFLYLLFNTKRHEKIIVYHEIKFCRILYWLKKIKKLRYILEVEELYTDIRSYSKTVRKNEFRMCSIADAYIFSTELLDEKLNTSGKPSVVIYGTYNCEESLGICLFDDDKIHCVYGGTFDLKKGGATGAVSAAEFLPRNYHIHILGFGTEEEKKVLVSQVKMANRKGGATVTMDGMLSGKEYVKFIQSCDIGFSTQIPEGAYNDSSFPSKVLSYMANGLRVVSVKLPVLERSRVNSLLYYYENNTPKEIADAVQSIDFNKPYNSRDIIKELDKKFVKEIGDIISK